MYIYIYITEETDSRLGEAKESKVSEVKMAMKTEGHKQFSPLDYKTPPDDSRKANQYPQVTPSVITTTSYSSLSPINCISHMTPIKTTSAPCKLPPKPEDYLNYEDKKFSVYTQYEAEKLQKDISRVMHVNNDYQKTHL